jgi:hypothetical protein
MNIEARDRPSVRRVIDALLTGALGEDGFIAGKLFAAQCGFPDCRITARTDLLLRMKETFWHAVSNREAALQMSSRISRFRAGRWRDTRALDTCPFPAGSLNGALWALMRVCDRDMGAETIRHALGSQPVGKKSGVFFTHAHLDTDRTNRRAKEGNRHG